MTLATSHKCHMIVPLTSDVLLPATATAIKQDFLHAIILPATLKDIKFTSVEKQLPDAFEETIPYTLHSAMSKNQSIPIKFTEKLYIYFSL